MSVKRADKIHPEPLARRRESDYVKNANDVHVDGCDVCADGDGDLAVADRRGGGTSRPRHRSSTKPNAKSSTRIRRNQQTKTNENTAGSASKKNDKAIKL